MADVKFSGIYTALLTPFDKNSKINEKALIDQLRCRNGNLEICISCQDSSVTEL